MTSNSPRDLAVAIAETHRLDADALSPIVGAGSVNHVFRARSGDGGHIIRFAIDEAREDFVAVEAWALGRAAAHGIPSPTVVASGRLRGVPYLVQTFVKGVAGTERRSPRLWRTLGEYARTVHAIDVADAPDALFSRFGRDLPLAWRSHLDYNIRQLDGSDPLVGLGVYAPNQQGALRARIVALGTRELTFGLNHGDLALRNLIVGEAGPPVLIDWGSAGAGPAPWGELVTLLAEHRRHDDPSAAELDAFADGYGLVLPELLSTVEDLTLLGALDLVRWAIDRRPDLVEETAGAARDRVAAALTRS